MLRAAHTVRREVPVAETASPPQNTEGAQREEFFSALALRSAASAAVKKSFAASLLEQQPKI